MAKRPSLRSIIGQSQEVPRVTSENSPKRGRPIDAGSLSKRLEQGEYKQLKTIIPANLHKKIKILSAEQDRDMSDIVREALETWIKGQGHS
jgi:hypothetical protein